MILPLVPTHRAEPLCWYSFCEVDGGSRLRYVQDMQINGRYNVEDRGQCFFVELCGTTLKTPHLQKQMAYNLGLKIPDLEPP